jgi:Na+-driven multidrug efflux pump
VELVVAFLTLLYNHILMVLFGESSLTIYAVIAYVNLFAFMIMQGVAQGMMHLVSLQIGASNQTAAAGYFRMCILTSLTLSLLLTGLCLGIPETIVGMLLKADSEVFPEAVRALRQFSLSFPLVGLNIAIASYFTARGLSIPSAGLALGRGFVFTPIVLLILSFCSQGSWIWMSAFFGELTCFLVSLSVLRCAKLRGKVPSNTVS